MNVILLKDLSENAVDAVILTKNTSPERLQNIINNVKSEHEEDYQWEDLVEALPGDCEIYSCFGNEVDSIYY